MIKARLIESDERFVLLLCSGRIIIYDEMTKVRGYIENYFSDQYDMSPTWPHDTPMEEFEGETISIVDSEGHLVVYNGPRFKEILKAEPSIYLTVLEYAEKHGKGRNLIAKLCREGRIPGVIQKGKSWLIPSDAPYPKDARFGKRV